MNENQFKNVIKEQFVKVAVLNTDFKQYKLYVKEKQDKFERMYEEMIGKLDIQNIIIDQVKVKQSKVINLDEIDMLKSKVT